MKLVFTIFFLVILSGCKTLNFKAQELSLTKLSVEETSIIRVPTGDERTGRSFWNPKPPLSTTLVQIHDIESSGNIINLIDGNYFPRVDVGTYIVRVHCAMNGPYVRSYTNHDVEISVIKGSTYLVECLGDLNSQRVNVRTLPNPNK